MAGQKNRNAKKDTGKTFASKRTMNPPQARGQRRRASKSIASFQEHDVERRLGSFEQAGEHARTGSRGHE